MTTPIPPPVCLPPPTNDFDRAFDAAVRCGWDGPSAFAAVVIMVAHGIRENEVERLFIDAAWRVQ